RFLGEIGLARDIDLGGRTHELQVRRRHDAARNAHVAGDVVERETVAEDVAVIERDSSRERLQRQDAEQFARARLQLGETARTQMDAERPVERIEVELMGRAGPSELSFDARRRSLEPIGISVSREESTWILRVEDNIELRLLLPPGNTPCAIRFEVPRFVGEGQALDP